jgi:uracil-DNA glycosylase
MTPKFSDTFRAFKECPWDKLHTVLLGQDPYPGKIDKTTYVADGLAFSSKNSKSCPKTLNYILESIDRDIYEGKGYELAKTTDLTAWANQGILLLNTALSFPIGQKSGAHVDLWHPFISYVLKTINEKKSAIAVGLFGGYAKQYQRLLTNDSFGVYVAEHPCAASYRGGKWRDNNIFRSIDGYHKFINNIFIQW